MSDAADQNTVPPLRELRVVVDSTLPRDEIRCHPAVFDLLQRAFLEADLIRHPELVTALASANRA